MQHEWHPLLVAGVEFWCDAA